jgi:hypothetical protein
MTHALHIAAVAALALSMIACSPDDTSRSAGSGAGSGATGGGGDALPPPVCEAGTRWTPGAPAFRDATADFGLDGTGASGFRLSAVDFDGDGWADIIARRYGWGADDFSEGGGRQTWLLRNTGTGRFEDVTAASGLRANRTEPDPNRGRPGEVMVFADVDNDGDLDAYTGLSAPLDQPQVETSEIMVNQGNGTFALGPVDSGVRIEAPEREGPAGAAFVDWNRDGLVDLWVAHGMYDYQPLQDRLYRGDGTGRFTDVTLDAGLATKPWVKVSDLNAARAHSYAWSAAACDLNGDGDAELLAASYGRAPNHLWQSNGPESGFQFVNRSLESGYAFDDRVDWTDNESARCHCKLHPDDADCAGVPPPAYFVCNVDADAFRWDHTYDREPFKLGGNSGTTSCADIDNDGDVDLVTSEIVHWDVGASSDPAEILLNTGAADATFARPGNDVTGLVRQHEGVVWDEGVITQSVLDFDNDGWPDIYLGDGDYPGTHGRLFHQASPGLFEPVPIDVGIDHHRSRGVAAADFDRDGDIDLVVGHSLGNCAADCYATDQIRLFENVIGQGGHFVQLTLVGGPGTNRAAIGARVTVEADGVRQTKDVGGGYGHFGAQDDLTLHFGLGDACEAEVTVRWPDGMLTTEAFVLQAGQRFVVRQGEAPAVAAR